MMPKGFKSKTGYGSAKLFEGKTYHEISSELKDHGYKINHSSCRNDFISSLMKIAEEIGGLYGLNHDSKELKSIAIDPEFQESVRDLMEGIDAKRKQSKFNF